jgi:C-terminal processing protease CtpA/Prc
MYQLCYLILCNRLRLFVFLLLSSSLVFGQLYVTEVGEEERRDVVENISDLINDTYLFPDVGKQSTLFINKQLKSGMYDSFLDPVSFAQKLTDDLQSINHDKHMRVIVKSAKQLELEAKDYALNSVKRERYPREHNYGFQKVERLDGNVGYIDFRVFDKNNSARETAAAALKFLSNSDALIIDMRKNRGGSPSMVQLISSYFFKKKTLLNTMYSPRTGKPQELWTLDNIPGERLLDVPVYILTSNSTFSAAESFTYIFKNRDRATIVGETSKGGANAGRRLIATNRFAIFIPNRQPIYPITGKNWEGVGVVPDVIVPADNAFNTAYKLAKKAAEKYRKNDINGKMVPIINAQKEFKEKLSNANGL